MQCLYTVSNEMAFWNLDASALYKEWEEVATCRYVMEAIRKSTMFTYNLEQADIVFVDSYCYYIWWLGWSHSRGRTHEGSPGEYLMAAFKGVPLTLHLTQISHYTSTAQHHGPVHISDYLRE